MIAGTDSDAGCAIACLAVIQRLETVIEEENGALLAQEMQAHSSYGQRKHQLLRDLMSAQRGCRDMSSLQILADDYARLKGKLARNAKLLGDHIRALEEVSAIIIDSIKQAESDGTYSHQTVRRLR